ncbi:MAG TPA: MFS transporter [Trebonia sp.]|nr:MFS transporter [Trebonia sp.]
MPKGPLAGRYMMVATMVIVALVPYLTLSAALGPVGPVIALRLHMTLQTFFLANGMANAGYAAGTILAVQIAQQQPQRRMLLVYGTLLVIGSVLAAAAPDAGVFIAGHVLQGLCTSLLLIAAVPPLITQFPLSRLRTTVVYLNICIFGAVALGPVLGGLQANQPGWRPLFWVIAGIAVLALLLSVLTFEDVPAADPSAPRDPIAIVLATFGCVASFYGASELLTHSFGDPIAYGPLAGGLFLIFLLFVHQYRARRPLLLIKDLISTFPTAAILVAVCAAAAAQSAIVLTGGVLAKRYTPLDLGLLYLPEVAGTLIAAVVFAALFHRSELHYAVLAGLIFLTAGVLVLNGAAPPTLPLVVVGAGLVGVGLGASVVPALFIAAFSLHAHNVQRVFAIIELLRAVGAFLVAPILLHVALTTGGSPVAGLRTALWACFGISLGAAVIGLGLYLLGGVRPPAPALDRWSSGEDPAWDSPPLLAGIRRR